MKRTSVALFIMVSLFCGVTFFSKTANAQYGSSCSDQYGYMAYEDYSGYCKCMSGYVFGTDFLGKKSCVSATTLCYDKYGYGSTYNSLSNSCECSYGYVFGKDSIGRTQCITTSTMCTNQLGYNSSYNSLYGSCECDSGYVISGGQCVNGDSLCHSRNGLYSSYNRLSKSCECDSGYTLGNSYQCVQKQNNVYFTLKELDTDEKRAIIKSDYDYSYYLISYNSGCYNSSFRRYLNHQIVVNLGIDYDLDTWDKIVLQDDDESCDITYRERADSSTTLVPEEPQQIYYFTPQPVAPPQPVVMKKPEVVKQATPQSPEVTAPVIKTVKINDDKVVEKSGSRVDEQKSKDELSTTTQVTQEPTKKVAWYQKIFSWFGWK